MKRTSQSPVCAGHAMQSIKLLTGKDLRQYISLHAATTSSWRPRRTTPEALFRNN